MANEQILGTVPDVGFDAGATRRESLVQRNFTLVVIVRVTWDRIDALTKTSWIVREGARNGTCLTP